MTASDEAGFSTAFYSAGIVPVLINPQETWNWPAFSGQMTQALNEPVSVKLRVFYGGAKPVEANFRIRKQE